MVTTMPTKDDLSIPKRRLTRQVQCGSIFAGYVKIGGDAPISIQSMTNTFTEDTEATADQIKSLADAGADIVRCAVPTPEAAEAIAEIKSKLAAKDIYVPLVADIHFDYRIAIAAIKAGADKIRINPGNIGDDERVKAVVDAAGEAGIPIRIGVNGGSLEADLKELYTQEPARALAESALRNIRRIEGMGFQNLVVSIKSSDVMTNTEAHRLLAGKTDVPLHIGITEAGFGSAAVAKSAVGIGALLVMGLGNTIRVSLTGDPVAEISATKDILRAANLLPGQITLISCPTCGRTKADVSAVCAEVSEEVRKIEDERRKAAKRLRIAQDLEAAYPQDEFEKLIFDTERPITVAVMGCAVNGPGEASHADLGVACGVDTGLYFEKGVKGGTVPREQIAQAVITGLEELVCKLISTSDKANLAIRCIDENTPKAF